MCASVCLGWPRSLSKGHIKGSKYMIKFIKYIYANALSSDLIYFCFWHATLRSLVFTKQYVSKYCYNVAETTGGIVYFILCCVIDDPFHKKYWMWLRLKDLNLVSVSCFTKMRNFYFFFTLNHYILLWCVSPRFLCDTTLLDILWCITLVRNYFVTWPILIKIP